jgi:polyhydroxyalkanoate synthase
MNPSPYRRGSFSIPPWINKFYILDLQPKNSFIKYCVDQGFTVFVLSWINPDQELSHKSFEHYMLEGPLAALDAIAQATGEREVNAVGYCLGGTLLAATLAWMREKGDDRIRSATFFTTLVDFTDPGELGVFMDEEQLTALEKIMVKRGYLDGAEMAASFNLLRASDLIWSFVINNYLLGKDPFPFDLLYWNSDNTRMPAAMHSFYLRKCYYENVLVQPGGVDLGGVPIDLTRIDLPVLLGLHQGGSYRPLEEHLRRDAALPGPEEVRVGRLWTHCRRDQPARHRQIRLLAQRRATGRPGRLVRRCPKS